MSAERFMSPNLITASFDQKVSDALMQMCKHRIHNLPVMDEEGNFIGLFGLRNLLHSLLQIFISIFAISAKTGRDIGWCIQTLVTVR